ncbi:GNAT family N-acetyltransferase [Sporolactobacillus spathodeae]|uniref:RimJ/RimL family protein N-acetyltransferase n=1 Tax=Sporolactobacillus spathodeae TaxID=1465502 RepID=A0ABS2Q7E4_9BACL|nr:GNAT family N-acetyltransferase [Sporolactobacillus spathodeae]MBM7657697.1 RimJ/RimL family protein N-acetyltransferase [Sporolactobacillus spathodeae]
MTDTIKIETSRLFIKPLTTNEMKQINNNEKSRNVMAIDPDAISDSVQIAIAKKLTKMSHADKEWQPWYTYWLIIDKASGTGIGFIGFKGFPGINGCTEIGYSLSPKFRSRGLMTESLAAMVEWARTCPRCRGITAKIVKGNDASIKVVVNCAFQLVRREPDQYLFLYRFHDGIREE